MVVKVLFLVIHSDLFGMVKWPFKALSDLQLGAKKATLNHLVKGQWHASHWFCKGTAWIHDLQQSRLGRRKVRHRSLHRRRGRGGGRGWIGTWDRGDDDLVGGFNPFEKYARQDGNLPPKRGENKNILETTTQWWFLYLPNYFTSSDPHYDMSSEEKSGWGLLSDLKNMIVVMYTQKYNIWVFLVEWFLFFFVPPIPFDPNTKVLFGLFVHVFCNEVKEEIHHTSTAFEQNMNIEPVPERYKNRPWEY